MTKNLLLCISLFILCFTLHAQTRKFKKLTSSDGISQSEIYTFLEDSRGFMWFGSVDGLNKYDGYGIEIFNAKKNDINSLSNNTIRSLAEDRFGNIWIGTDDGLNLYDAKKELIHQIPIDGINGKISIWSLCILDGYLMIGVDSGLLRMKIEPVGGQGWKFEPVETKNFNEGFDTNRLVRAIKKSKYGGIWILTSNHIARVIFDKNEYVVIENIKFNDNPLNCIAEDFSGNLWITTEKNGILRYNIKSETIAEFKKDGTCFGPSSNKGSFLELDKDGNLWIGTLDNGLNFVKSTELNEQKIYFETIQNTPLDPNGINSNLIYTLYVSSSNQLWVGTIGSGVNIFDPHQKEFAHYKVGELNNELINSNFIRSVYADANNHIWAGAHANGLLLINRENKKFEQLGFDTQSIFYISSYKHNRKLICSSSGIYLVDLANGRLRIISSYECGPVFYVEPSNSETYWCATLTGLVRIQITNDQINFDKTYTTKTAPAISQDNCRVLFYNKKNNSLYVGTEGGGLNIISLDDKHYPQTVHVFVADLTATSISNNYVRSIIQDINQNIWVGTYYGLNKIISYPEKDKISFKTYTKEDGLPNNMIQLLVEDDSNNIWIGTNGGLSKFISKEEQFVNYTEEDGLQSNEFSEHTVYRTQEGEIIIGGINGINTFYPKNIKRSSFNPKTLITEFYISNEKITPLKRINGKVILDESILYTSKITLSPKHKNIGFKFSAMIFSNASQIKYAYMLEGFNKEWQYVDGNSRMANYTNLKHGHYIFKVKSTNADGVWSNSYTEIEIVINTPFVYTWYAKLIYVIIAAILVVLVMRFAYNRKKSSLEKKHQEKLFQLENLRAKLFINISHDLRTPLTLIREPLDAVLKNNELDSSVRDRLLLIKRNVKRLNYLVEQLLDVRKAESGTLKAKLKLEDIVAFTKEQMSHFSYAISQKDLEMVLICADEKLLVSFDRAMLSKIYFNIISNAIKYTNQGKIEIRIEKTIKNLDSSNPNSFVKIEICDTGFGMSTEQCDRVFDRFYQVQEQTSKGYGIGMSHAKELIEAHNGTIEVESREGMGTTIRFYIPDIIEYSEIKKITLDANEDVFIDQEPTSTYEQEETGKKAKTIMIVEDNVDMRNFIRSEFKSEYNVIEACDGLDGLEKIKVHFPDLIISDIIMPNMDGVELCEKVKTNLETCHIPFILLTAKTDIATKYEGIKIGADDYIPKPFEMEYLSIRVKNLLDSRDMLRNIFQKSTVFEPSAVTITSLDEKFLRSVIDYIDEGIPDSEFSINTLESKLAMSHAQFYRKIKSLTGQSGQELLLTMRMKRAHKILSENNGIRVSDVTYMVGFSNPKYFSKCFKEFWNMTPSDVSKTEK